jgi:hypothetical protein
MKANDILHIDSYVYTGKAKVLFNKPHTIKVNLRPGRLFYYVTKTEPGDFIGNSPDGPFLRISEQTFTYLSDNSKEHLQNAGAQVIEPSDSSRRTFKHAAEYQFECVQHRELIYTETRRFLKDNLPPEAAVKRISELGPTTAFGQIGSLSLYKGITFKVAIYLSVNPFISYSIWIPSKESKVEAHLPLYAKRMSRNFIEFHKQLLTKLKFRINPVSKRKSTVHLPERHFNGVILHWASKI